MTAIIKMFFIMGITWLAEIVSFSIDWNEPSNSDNKISFAFSVINALQVNKQNVNISSFVLSEALAIDPHNRSTNAKLYFNRATVAAKLKRTSESIADCDKALELDPSYTKALLR